jgi:hypothetical protein
MEHLFYLTVYKHDAKIRLGDNCDGGYVIGENIGGYDCYISAGVGDQESFSRDFIKKFDLDKSKCYAFDGTIDDYPYRFTNEITFIKKNIGQEQTEMTTNLKEYNEKFRNIFLKMDIEGGEYPWLESLNEIDLLHYKQIVMEFHGINDNSWNSSYQTKVKCLKKLANTHFIVHAHGNNWAGIKYINNIVVPDVIELTFIRKDMLINPDFNSTSFPIENLDYKNNGSNPDICLTQAPFKC